MSGEYFVVRRSSTALSNAVIHDRELSLGALGLLMVSLSLPPSAPHGYRAFMGRGLGEKAIRRGLRELEERGYRYRFRARRQGQVREVTVISDEPLTVADARAEVTGMMASGMLRAATLGDCVSHPELSTGESEARPVDNDRAADVAARSGTVPCSSAARWSAADPKGSNTSLRSVNTNQPAAQPPAEESQSEPESSASLPGGGCPDWELISRCLPAPMRTGLTAPAGTRITVSLRQAQTAGWSTGAIYRHLNANPMPQAPANHVGLVIHRVEQLAASPPPARQPPPDDQGPPAGSRPAVAVCLSGAEIDEAARSLKANTALSDSLRERLLVRLHHTSE